MTCDSKWISVAGSRELSAALQKIAFAAGWVWGDGATSVYERYNNILAFYPAERMIYQTSSTVEHHRECCGSQELKSLEEAVKFIQQPKEPEFPTLAGHKPKLNADGSFTVGCTTVDFETMKKIFTVATETRKKAGLSV
jgi:hypothetical protein